MATTDTRTRPLDGTTMFPIGLGGMPLSVSGRPDEAQAIRTVHAALDAGVTLIDTADAYALDESEVGHNERLIAKALRGRREDVLVATKGGHVRRGRAWELDGSPRHLRAACEASLRALETDRIDLYQYHRPDPARALRRVGGRAQGAARRGQGPLGRAVERRRRPARGGAGHRRGRRGAEPARAGLHEPAGQGRGARPARERGIAFLPWSPLGGIGKAGGTAGVEAVRAAAERHGVSPQQVVLAWLLSLGPTVIPIPGARRPETISDSLAAAALRLDDEELGAITAAVSG